VPDDGDEIKSNKKDSFTKVMEKVAKRMEVNQEESKKQRAASLEMQSRTEESNGCSEHTKMAKELRDMHADASDNEDELLVNLAVRVDTLEKRLGVTRSVPTKLGLEAKDDANSDVAMPN
jgi:hypothetical protein